MNIFWRTLRNLYPVRHPPPLEGLGEVFPICTPLLSEGLGEALPPLKIPCHSPSFGGAWGGSFPIPFGGAWGGFPST